MFDRACALGAVLLAFAAAAARADDAPLAAYGGAVRLMTKGAVQISMSTETVVIRPGDSSYRVAAIFEFYNHGESTSIPVGFPNVYPMGRLSAGSPITDFARWVDGVRVPVEEVSQIEKTGRRPFDAAASVPGEEVKWLASRIAFKGHARTVVWVSYTGEYDPRNLAETDQMAYMFGTGRPWKGPIGDALFVIQRDPRRNPWKAAFDGVPAGATRAMRFGDFLYGFEFKNLTPKPFAEISLAAMPHWPADLMTDLGTGASVDVDAASYDNWPYAKKALPREVLVSLSLKELRVLRNVFFAGHGRLFDDAELRETFYDQPWYRRRPEYKDSDLGSVEKANVRAVAQYEKDLRERPAELVSDLGRRVDRATLDLLLGGPALAGPPEPAPKRASNAKEDAVAEGGGWTLRSSLALELPWGEISRVLENSPRGPGPFVVDEKGRILIADVSDQDLRLYAPSGRLLRKGAVHAGVLLGVALGPGGRIYALARDLKAHAYRIEELDENLMPVRDIAGPAGDPMDDAAYYDPREMAVRDLIEVDARGRLFVHDGNKELTYARAPGGEGWERFGDLQAGTLLCRGQAEVRWRKVGAMLVGFTVESSDGKPLLDGKGDFLGCGGRHALTLGDAQGSQALTLLDLQDGSRSSITLPAGMIPDLDFFSVGIRRWISTDGDLYVQGTPESNAFRIFKFELSRSVPRRSNRLESH